MRRSLVFALLLSSLAASCGLVVGCKKSAPAASGALDGFTIAGAADVSAALQKKDYDAAVKALAKIGESAGPDQQQEFRSLLKLVMNELRALENPDEKAKQALDAVRQMGMTR